MFGKRTKFGYLPVGRIFIFAIPPAEEAETTAYRIIAGRMVTDRLKNDGPGRWTPVGSQFIVKNPDWMCIEME